MNDTEMIYENMDVFSVLVLSLNN